MFELFLATALASVILYLVQLELRLARLSQANPTGVDGSRAKELVGPLEHDFLRRLEAAAPELRFHCNVSTTALLASEKSVYLRWRSHLLIRPAHMVAQRKSDGSILAIIELDFGHPQGLADTIRHATFSKAGYRMVHWNAADKPPASAIRAQLFPARTLRNIAQRSGSDPAP